MRQKEWSRFAVFVAVGVLVGVIVDRYVIGFHLEPAEPQRVAVVEATPTPSVVNEPEPAPITPLASATETEPAKVVPPRRRATKPTVVATRPLASVTATPTAAYTGSVIDPSR